MTLGRMEEQIEGVGVGDVEDVYPMLDSEWSQLLEWFQDWRESPLDDRWQCWREELGRCLDGQVEEFDDLFQNDLDLGSLAIIAGIVIVVIVVRGTVLVVFVMAAGGWRDLMKWMIMII